MVEAQVSSMPKWFAEFVGADPAAWARLYGAVLVHRRYGEGIISGVNTWVGNTYIDVRFKGQPSTADSQRLSPAQFLDGTVVECHFETEPEGFVEFCALRVLEETAAAERAARDHAHKEKLRREHEAEAAAERDFRELSKKYRARWTPQDALLGPLHQVILRLDEGGLLTGNDLSWLKQQKQYGPLALTLERSFAAGGDPWEMVKAASFWRKAEEPERALALLADFQADESRLRAAALTARGAAYEDLGNHAHAAADAELAVSLAPTAFHPHNLLGRIYYARGLPGAGDRHFDRAEELGSSARDSEQTRKVAVRQTTGQTRREIASYLLAKDPERYAWVRQYLGDVTAEK